MRVNQTPDLKMVILLQPPRDYMSQLPTPPKPPRPPRLLGKPPKRDGKSVRIEPVASPPRDQRNDDLSSIGSASDTSEMSVVPNKSRRVKSEPRDAPPQHEHITNVAILRTGYVADSSSSPSQDDPSGLVLHVDDDGSVEKQYPESLIPRIMVFTSRPLLAVRPNVRTMDVGWNGEYLPAMQGTPDL